MHDPALLAALGVLVLAAAGLVLVAASEGRRRALQDRLGEIAAGSRGNATDEPAVTLRRRRRQTGWRGFFALSGDLRTTFDAALAATGNRIGAPHLIGVAIIAAIAVGAFVVVVLQLNPLYAMVLGGVAAVVAPYLLLWLMQARYQRQFLELFPDALDLIVRGVRAGLPPLDAFEVAAREMQAPINREFRHALDEMEIGVAMDAALEHTADRVRVPDFRFFVVAVILQRRTGGSLAETLATLSGVIRQRRMLRMKARALTAETKASSVVIAIAPVVGFVGLYMISPTLMSVMFHDPRGRFMLGAAIVFLIGGMITMAMIIKRVLR